ncbi:MAG TPA: MAPEG family protein [Kofleriaceae bacterium]|nr:MAPEG family protein [Kofleriaceae bacterium]
MSLRAWVAPRKATLISIAIGTASYPIALWIAWRAWPEVAPIASAGERVAYAAELLVAVAVVVLLIVSRLFRTFDTAKAEDPFAGAESQRWRVNQRVLQNTVEQAMIFVPALLALAARVEPGHVRILPVLTALWCAGRILFWIGYRVKPVLRGPGFEWTLYSSVLAIGWYVWAALG